MNPWGDDSDPYDYSSPDVHDIRQDNGPYVELQSPTRFAPQRPLWPAPAPHYVPMPQWDGDARLYSWAPVPQRDPNTPRFEPPAPGPLVDDDSQPLPLQQWAQLPSYFPQWDRPQMIPVDNDSLPYQSGGNDNASYMQWAAADNFAPAPTYNGGPY